MGRSTDAYLETIDRLLVRLEEAISDAKRHTADLRCQVLVVEEKPDADDTAQT